NVAQRPPHALLERGAAHVQRQVQPDRRSLDETDHLGHQLLVVSVAADQPGLRKTILQIARQRVGIVAKQDRAYAAFALRDQDRAQRTLADGEADFAVGTAGAIVRWRHAK